MILVDSHCHLNFPDFEGKIDEVVKAAVDADIKYMQTICTKISEYDEVYSIAEEFENVFCSVGIHPHEADKGDIGLVELIELSKRKKCIGIGETGLDYYYDNSPREEQKKSFKIHLEAAAETNLPIIIHTRDAEEDTFNMLKEQMDKKPFRGLLHCFTGTSEMAIKCMELGLYVSISGIVTFKNAKDLQETVKNDIPLDRLLVETDSPFLAPVPHRGKPCQPAYTRKTAEFIAELKEIKLEELAEKTTNNFFTLFDKAWK